MSPPGHVRPGVPVSRRLPQGMRTLLPPPGAEQAGPTMRPRPQSPIRAREAA
ncbi:MAG TPA: hypothetical protein VM286_07655 [Candidatus Thermoplasmatota archaeon]|nr:hypothetical protein [Candidatus Thermoplasmatota archaeon]